MNSGLKFRGRHGKLLELGEKTVVCGILNITPDSFFDGGLYNNKRKAIERARQLVHEGAEMLDIGGASSRPGADPVAADEERKRIMPVLEALVDEVDILISVDTYRSQIAKEALEIGVDIINDITSLGEDPDMAYVVAESGAGMVLMHMQGSPSTMQKNPKYDDVIAEISSFLQEAFNTAAASGIDKDKIAIDPGIGFGKRPEHNLEIIRRLSELRDLGQPIFIGVSRKSIIGDVLNLPLDERIEGTAALVACSIMNGANIVRVHDVKYMSRVARMADAIRKGISYA